MIDASYVQLMSRFNMWQNNQLAESIDAMDDVSLRQDRGAFFGSILATLNHILLADILWLERLGNHADELLQRIRKIENATATGAQWRALRKDVDALILVWAESVDDNVLASEVDWSSRVLAQSFCHPYDICVMHFFNHQTHHRGQVHAMLTASGHAAPTTDIVFMPEIA
ncbi:MAG: DinB family protein [Sulfitobacter sp.]